MRHRIASAALVVGLLSAFPTFVTLGAGAEDAPTDLASAIQFREAFGLNSDAGFVERIERDPSASRTYGVALTDLEHADLERRDEIQAQLGSAIDYLKSHPDRFGGLFIDQQSGGLMVVNLVGGTTDDEEQVKALLPDGATVEFREVETTEAELAALHSRVDSELPALEAAGIRVNLVTTSVRDNAVRIGLDRLDPTWIGKVRDSLPEGVAIVEQGPIAPSACTRSFCPTPERLRAGLEIKRVTGGKEYICTSGFLVHGGTNTQMLTAGHCFNDPAIEHGRLGLPVTHTNQSIGTVSAETYYDGSDADAMLIDIPNSRESNWVFTTYSMENLGYAVEGMNVCRSGIVSLVDCGPVEATFDTVTYSISGMTFVKQVRVGVVSVQGDSGGPWYLLSPGRAFGIHSGHGGTDSWFSAMDEILINFNKDLCITLSC
jgi:hypothetical protein